MISMIQSIERRQAIRATFEHSSEWLRFPQVRIHMRQRFQPIERKGKLDTVRLLWPKRAVVVEYSDAPTRRHQIRGPVRRDAFHKIHKARSCRAFVRTLELGFLVPEADAASACAMPHFHADLSLAGGEGLLVRSCELTGAFSLLRPSRAAIAFLSVSRMRSSAVASTALGSR